MVMYPSSSGMMLGIVGYVALRFIGQSKISGKQGIEQIT